MGDILTRPPDIGGNGSARRGHRGSAYASVSVALAASQTLTPVASPSSATADWVTSTSVGGAPSTCSRTRSESSSIACTRPSQTLRVLRPSGCSRCTVTALGRSETSTGPGAASVDDDQPPAPGQADLAALLEGARPEVQTDEPRDVRRGGVPGHLRGRALLDEPAALDHQQPVGQHHRLERVVGDQHDRSREGAEVLAQEAADVDARARVERGHRLVEQQHLRLRGQHPGQRDPLRLPSRELGRRPAGEVAEPQAREPRDRLGAGLRPRGAGRPRSEGDVVAHVEVREEPVVLEDDTDGALLGGQVGPWSHQTWSPTTTDPPASGSRPAIARSSVVLPAPLGPSTASTSPGSTVKATATSKSPRRTTPSKRRFGSGHCVTAPTRRPRSRKSTVTDTARSTSESAIAASGSVSIAT